MPMLRSTGLKMLLSVAMPAALENGCLLQSCLLLECLVPWCYPGSCACVSMIFLLEQEKDWI